MRFACDTGGTFTDLIVEDDNAGIRMYKAPTTPDNPVEGVLDAFSKAAADYGLSLSGLLARGDLFIHGTTHAINAIVTDNTAKTAFMTTEGHPDILVLREGGRSELFNHSIPYPRPYVPRSLSFEAPGRIDAQGQIITPLDEPAVIDAMKKMAEQNVEAVAVCLLWSVVNPSHEIRVGELLKEVLPGVPYTLSHRLNPTIREYRRASSTCIDASLKPLMTRYMTGLTNRMSEAGFKGRILMLTSGGGMLDVKDVAATPIHLVNSGPSMAPVAGRHYAQTYAAACDIIVADTGGTTYDVSIVRNGHIPVSNEVWIGVPYRGHMTGFPSVDVKSIGAGGGSIAWVDSGGLLHVGPESAGADPGPVCYGRGGVLPTVTDASLVLGHLDPGNFLGGTMSLDKNAADKAIEEQIAVPLGFSVEQAAAAVLEVTTENMVQAIADITVKQGIDPAQAILIGGGGAAGLNSVWIARRLGCRRIIFPETGAALSAVGALLSDLTAEYKKMLFTTTDDFDFEGVNAMLGEFEVNCDAFMKGPGVQAVRFSVEITAQARYRHQVWEIELPIRATCFEGQNDVSSLIEEFHAEHERIFAVRDPQSAVELVSWTATVRCALRETSAGRLDVDACEPVSGCRKVFFPDEGWNMANVYDFTTLPSGDELKGPAIIESPFSTVVVPPGAFFVKGEIGNLEVRP